MSLSSKKKIILRIFVKYKCEECKKDEKEVGELEVHKINPKLGYSSFRNLKLVCKSCHEKFSSAQRIAMGVQRI